MLERNKRSLRPKRPGTLFMHLLAWGLLAAFLIPICLVPALYVPAVQKQLITKLVHQIEAGTGTEIQFELSGWQPFSRLNLSKVKVRSAGNDLFECSSAQLTYHFITEWPYLSPDDLYLDKPIFSLEKSSKGTLLFPGRAPSQQSSAPPRESGDRLTGSLPKVRVSSGTVLIRQNGRTVGTMRGLNGTLPFKVVQGPEGPSIALDLGQWQGLNDLPRPGGRENSRSQAGSKATM